MPPEKNIDFTAGSSRSLWVAFALLLASYALFMMLNVKGDRNFVLNLHLTKLAALLMIAYAAGVSMQLLQTLTNNLILTPSISGFDSLYVFSQTLLVFMLGGVGCVSLPLTGKSGFELVIMMGGSLLLFYTLIKQGGRDLSRMTLIGMIFGILFRSLSSLLSRMTDPEESTTAQANISAIFNTVHSELSDIDAVVLFISATVVWHERYHLDVYLPGRNQATNLGTNYTRNTLRLLLQIVALAATATTVVGPVSFFGLLVAVLANHFSPPVKHSARLPMILCAGGTLLVGGQTIFEHFLDMQAVLSAVVEFADGLVFLYLVLKKK